MHWLRLSCAFAVICGTSASAASPVTTGQESDTDFDPEATVVIVAPVDGASFPGTPDAKVLVTAEYTGPVNKVFIFVDGVSEANCPVDDPFQCSAEVTLGPGEHELVAEAHVILNSYKSEPIHVTVTPQAESTGGSSGDGTDTSDATAGVTDGATVTTGAATGDSTGGTTGDDSTGDDTGAADKGCVCDGGGRPGPALAVACGLVALGRRRRRPRCLATTARW
jgi:hypothetical protein